MSEYRIVKVTTERPTQKYSISQGSYLETKQEITYELECLIQDKWRVLATYNDLNAAKRVLFYRRNEPKVIREILDD